VVYQDAHIARPRRLGFNNGTTHGRSKQDVDGNTRGDLRGPGKTANLWTRFGESGTLMLAFTFLSSDDGREPNTVLSSQCLSILWLSSMMF
jgi:hypothetical protein